MNKSIQINFKKLAGLLLPTFLRKPKIIAWFRVVTTPLQNLHDEFVTKCNEDLELLGYGSQVCYLRKALNDSFDPDKRRIIIISGVSEPPQYIYTKGEKKPVYLGKLYLSSKSNYANNNFDFIVKLPLEVYNKQKTEIAIGEFKHYKVEALVDRYKLASKRYIIEYFE